MTTRLPGAADARRRLPNPASALASVVPVGGMFIKGLGGRLSGFPDEVVACHFCVDIDGQLVAIFKECSGLSGEIEIETYREGGLNEYEHKLPGRAKYGNVTLRSGVGSSVELWDWFYEVATGEIERKNISVVMYLQDRGNVFQGEAMRWNLREAYPVRWQGPDFKADDNSVSVHSLELAHHGISLSRR